MRIRLSGGSLTSVSADLLVLPVTPGHPLVSAEAKALDRALGGQLGRELRRDPLRAKPDEGFVYQTHGALPSRHIAVIGRPDASGQWYRVADAVVRQARQLGARSAAIAVGAQADFATVVAVGEGLSLASYEFRRFRSKTRAARPTLRITLLTGHVAAALRRALAQSQVTAAATCFARDLINTPAGDLTPVRLAGEARRLAGARVRVRVLDSRGIARLGMGGLLGVARGSAEPPRFIELIYRPPGAARRRVALVGKGITFDSGGLSLKTADAMRHQKRDMAGGAIVLAVFKALAQLRPRVEVRGYVPATENMPGGRALKPGDVLRTFNGKTVEVLNTDAEGRLVLADALGYATSKHPDVIIDFATLTGAVNTALGGRYAAIMGTDRELVARCIAAATEVDEKLWELPLVAEYRSDIDSTIADIKNVGEGQASTIIGGLFLREFVGEVPWAHIDFSSTVMSSGYPCHPKGASGFGVRTVLRYLMQL